MTKITTIIKNLKLEITKLSNENKQAKVKTATKHLVESRAYLKSLSTLYAEIQDISTIKNRDYATLIKSDVNNCYTILSMGYNSLWANNLESSKTDFYKSEANSLKKMKFQ
jgi:hypothetical protein